MTARTVAEAPRPTERDAPPVEPVPFIDLAAQRRRLGRRIDDAMARVMEHGQFIMGPEVVRLEERLRAFAGVRHAVTCANGTDALTLVLTAWGIGPGDGVLVPSATFTATAEAVAVLGATPVFAEVREDTATLDPDRLDEAFAAARAAGLRPRAVIAVDLYGQPADYRRIVPWGRARGLKILADAAQSFGASLDGARSGGLADATTTSFFPAKPLGCYGDGGAVLTDDDDLAAVLRSLRVHGMGTHKYDNVRIGFNSRLDTLQAAVLLEKLEIFADELDAREAVARRYDAGLPPGVRPMTLIDGARSAWALYTVRFADGTGARDAAQARLAAAGIPSGVYYPVPLHRQPAYAGYPVPSGGLGASERLSSDMLSLPMHPYLAPDVQGRILRALREM